MKSQANLYWTHCQNLQMKYGIDLIQPYLSRGFHVLDVGCGTGNLTFYALDAVGTEGSVYGVDPDSSRIQVAKEISGDKPNATFEACKGSELVEKNVNTFDLAFSNAVLHWMDEEEKRATVKKVYDTLREGGLFLIQYTTPIPWLPLALAKFMGQMEKDILENRFHAMAIGNMAEICKQVGFNVLKSESFESKTVWANLTDLTELFTATFGCGRIDFTNIADKLRKEGMDVPTSWMEDNSFVHRAPINKLIIQKPVSLQQ